LGGGIEILARSEWVSWVETAEAPFLLEANPALADNVWEAVRDRSSLGRPGDEGRIRIGFGGSIGVGGDSSVEGSEGGLLALSAMM